MASQRDNELPGPAPGRRIGTVAAVTRYPVKSMQGEALDAGVVTATGLDGDRRWGVVHTRTGHVLTAKRTPRLLDARGRLTPAGPKIDLPDGTLLAGSGPRTDAALSAWLDVPVTLRPAGEAATPFTMSFNVDDEDADTFEWATPAGSFVDLAPIHVLTTAALAAAAEGHPDGAWSTHRFRPTILIDTDDTLPGFVENDWVGASLTVGDAVIGVTMPTVRCALPTKAQSRHDLGRDLQVFKSLAARNGQNLGAYAEVQVPGALRVGDTVELRSS